MAGFGFFTRDDSLEFELDRVDLNIWVLPALFRSNVYLVDVGMKLRLLEDAGRSTAPLAFRIGLPFRAEERPSDLIPKFDEGVSREALSSLVFGGERRLTVDPHGPPESPAMRGTWVTDGTENRNGVQAEGRMLFARIASDKSSVTTARTKDYSLWHIEVARGRYDNGSAVYVRFRFRTYSPGRLWGWQRGFDRKSRAILDLRVSDFRDKPDFAHGAPRWEVDVIPVGRVNAFVIAGSRLKAGRVSPDPKYVRVLENSVWEPYVDRKLGRDGAAYLITYWPQISVTQSAPFRAFLEVERRRPTAVRSVTFAAVALLLAIVLLQSPESLKASLAGVALAHTWSWLIVAVPATAAAWLIVKPVWAFIRTVPRRLRDLRAAAHRADAEANRVG